VARTLIRGGYVLSMDPELGDLPSADVLVSGDRIEAVGRDLPAGGVEVIDVAGGVVMPGFVDGHKHTWQTIFRGTSGDATLWQFFGEAVPATAPLMTPDDVYASNLLGALDALDAGITTILDWCHITLDPARTRAAVRGLRDAGVRAWFAHGAPQPTWSDKTLPHPADIERLKAEAFAEDGGLVRLAMAARGPMFANLDVTERDFALARRLGIPISVHVDMPGYEGDDVVRLSKMGALGADVSLLHGNTMSEREIDLAISAGARFVDSGPLDVLMGIGAPMTERLIARGARFGISPDTPVANPTDMFWVMRATVLLERQRAFGATFASGAQPPTSHLSARRILRAATIDAAHGVWLEDEVGSLTPGKQADVVVLRGTDLNLQPLNDVPTALVYGAHRGNVDTVLVAGRVVKRHGRLLDVDVERVVGLANEARDRVYDAAEQRGYRPDWRALAASATTQPARMSGRT
jgi:cytosine/adenosine deaminase-related metal-dependent hydrolase